MPYADPEKQKAYFREYQRGEVSKKWVAKNRDRINAARKKRRSDHTREVDRAWRAANKERVKEHKKATYNSAGAVKRAIKWKKANPTKVREIHFKYEYGEWWEAAMLLADIKKELKYEKANTEAPPRRPVEVNAEGSDRRYRYGSRQSRRLCRYGHHQNS